MRRSRTGGHDYAILFSPYVIRHIGRAVCSARVDHAQNGGTITAILLKVAARAHEIYINIYVCVINITRRTRESEKERRSNIIHETRSRDNVVARDPLHCE